MAFGINKAKNLHEMRRDEIVSRLIGFTVIGGAIEGIILYKILTWPEWTAWMLLWPAPAIVFVVAVVGTAYVQAFRELRSRRTGS